MHVHITKVDAARRQLDTAIDLYFDDADSLAVYTLAFASLKVLINLYPHHNGDGFSSQLDNLIGKKGWRLIAGVGSFLKHADRDPEGVLENFHAEMGLGVIGLASLLSRPVTGNFSIKMEACDCWVEILDADELGIPEVDQNLKRAASTQRTRDVLKQATREVRMAYAKKHYLFFLADRDRLQDEVNQSRDAGKALQQILDENLKA